MKSLLIRCGTPDCDWGHKVSDLSEEQLNLCYSELLQEWKTDAHMRLDLEQWTLELIRG